MGTSPAPSMDTSQAWTNARGEHYLVEVSDSGVSHYISNPGGMLKEHEHAMTAFRDCFTVCGIHRFVSEVSGQGFYSAEEEANYTNIWADEGEQRSICKRCQARAAKAEEPAAITTHIGSSFAQLLTEGHSTLCGSKGPAPVSRTEAYHTTKTYSYRLGIIQDKVTCPDCIAIFRSDHT